MAHTSYSELAERVQEAQKKIKVGGIYYHWKHPETHYKVLGIGFTEWNEELVVVYQNVDNQAIWVRRFEGEDGWTTPVEERPGEDKSRFTLVK